MDIDTNKAAPYVRGSDTSKAAADSITPVSGRLRQAVFTHIQVSGRYGCTDDEIEVALDLIHQTVSARRRELVQSLHVVNSGTRRKTRSGRTATVWVLRGYMEQE